MCGIVATRVTIHGQETIMDVEFARNILFGSVAIVAVASLLTLMRRRRDELVRDRLARHARTSPRPPSEPGPTAPENCTSEDDSLS
jgi:hypothetical protein